MMRNNPTGNAIQDLFVDSRKNVWVVMGGDSLLNTQDGNLIRLKRGMGVSPGSGYRWQARFVLSWIQGIVAVFQNDKLAYTASAYSTSEAQHYRSTSLTIQTPAAAQFYQIRTGHDEKNRDGCILSSCILIQKPGSFPGYSLAITSCIHSICHRTIRL